MLQCVAVSCSLLHSVLQCVAVCCSVLQCVAGCCTVCCSALQCVAVCCSVSQCVAVCCSVLQCDAWAGCRRHIKRRPRRNSMPAWIVAFLHWFKIGRDSRMCSASRHAILFPDSSPLWCDVCVQEVVGERIRARLFLFCWLPLLQIYVLVIYGVATISRLRKVIGLFCKRALQKRLYSAKETYDFKEPTNRSHPIRIAISASHLNIHTIFQRVI